MAKPPFNEGDLVFIVNNDHLGMHRVDTCEWFTETKTGVPHYWLCECTQVRELIDWSKIPAGATGIVTGSAWRGGSIHLVPAIEDAVVHLGAAIMQTVSSDDQIIMNHVRAAHATMIAVMRANRTARENAS